MGRSRDEGGNVANMYMHQTRKWNGREKHKRGNKEQTEKKKLVRIKGRIFQRV